MTNGHTRGAHGYFELLKAILGALSHQRPQNERLRHLEVRLEVDPGRLRDYVAWAKERKLDEEDEPGSATLLQTCPMDLVTQTSHVGSKYPT